jgi:membrane fusion protein (multidrug efflux system)
VKIRIAHVLIAVALLLPVGCDSSQKSAETQNKPEAVPVGVVTMKSGDVPYTSELPGRVSPYATAEIRPQVDGMVKKRVFEEGHEVKANDVLYQLDPTKFEAAKAVADAAVQKAAASVTNAQDKYDRTVTLAKTNAVSQQSLGDAKTALLQAQADMASARANQQTAQINLNDATIRAPIAGLIGKSSVSDGALVTANQTNALATLRQIDPVYVDLVDSSTHLLRIRTKVRSGSLGRNGKGPPKVTLKLEDGSTYDQTGQMSMADLVVSESTGTFALRATFPNPHRILLPGMFARATIDLGTTPNAFLVPQRAVNRDSSGKATVFVVGAGNKVETRTLTTDRDYNNSWVVTAGLKDGDKVIVDGLQNISNGTVVAPVEAKVDSDGVVKQTINDLPPTGSGKDAPSQ